MNKSLPHYESVQWKGHWSENKLKINVATCWKETVEKKCDIDDKDELQ